MIPKIIHYCWFGGNPLPSNVKKLISTWRKYNPDYEIVEWNESNFDINQNQYCKEAYESKKWAFVSDYARLKVLYDVGGIYMDTDVEVCKPFDDLLEYNAWSGFESEKQIPTGTIAACRENEWIGYLLKYYDDVNFIKPDGSLDMTTNVVTITRITEEKYDIKLNNTYQIFGDNYVLFPFEYLCAKSWRTGKVMRSKKTYTIHHFSGSWQSSTSKIKKYIRICLISIIGEDCFEYVKKLVW